MTAAATNGQPQPPGYPQQAAGPQSAARPQPDGLQAGAELLLLIREVLADVLPDLRDRLAAGNGATAPAHAPPPAVPPDLAPPVAPPTAIPAGIVADGDAQPPRSGATSPPPMLVGGLVFTGEHQTAHQPHGAGPAAPDGARAPARHVPTRAAASPHATSGVGGRGAAVRAVRLETDEDVRQFALDIVRLAGNPARRADLIAGRLRFTLAGPLAADAQRAQHRVDASAGAQRAQHRVDASAVTERAQHRVDAGAVTERAEHRVDAGAVTERVVQAAAKAGERLVLGPRAMLTPLARDRALALGVPIEKER